MISLRVGRFIFEFLSGFGIVFRARCPRSHCSIEGMEGFSSSRVDFVGNAALQRGGAIANALDAVLELPDDTVFDGNYIMDLVSTMESHSERALMVFGILHRENNAPSSWRVCRSGDVE